MPAIFDISPEFYNQANFTAVVGGRYAIRTTEAIGLTMTLPSNPGTGAVVEAVYNYGTGSFVINGGGANIYTTNNPYGTDWQNVASITFDGDSWCGHHFVCVFDGTSWTIGLALAASRNVNFRTGWLMMSAGNHFYMDAPNNNNGVDTGKIYWRTQNGNTLGEMYGRRIGYNVSVESDIYIAKSNGGWGYQNAIAWNTASPPRTYCYGELSAASVTNRSDSVLKDSPQPLHPGWIDALLQLPITTYMMGDPDLPPSEDYPEGRINPGRRRHLGFYAQDLEALAPAVQKTAAVFQPEPDAPREVDIMSMLALSIKTIQHLNDRITALEASIEGGK